MTHRIVYLPLFAAVMVSSGLQAAEPVRLSLGDGTVMRFTTPAPVLLDEQPLDPVVGVDGRASIAGLTLKRSIVKVEGRYAITLGNAGRAGCRQAGYSE